MLTFREEIERLKPLMDRDADEAYSFLSPLFSTPVGKPVVLYAAGKTCERVYKYLQSKEGQGFRSLRQKQARRVFRQRFGYYFTGRTVSALSERVDCRMHFQL